eukprot:CAMPEP_0194492836 /NCGR_PEP_ID=MMETSP0253-20130528/11253_1 /TAXON_ID=2966 /ORGANISM="Noctiluca scintillans" /LENGTH=371 /DNA_ID=CAMNT_0039333751 /DNA_START=50 /DNA_END=1165 /DNA_ORIENTATION=-
MAAEPKVMEDEYGAMNSAGETALVPKLALDSGYVMQGLEVRYRTWGELNASGSNAIVVCHALTGNANLEAWWGQLLGVGRPLDVSKYFIFCSNVLGSCYGTTGPMSTNPATGQKYGGSFPDITIRDMVRLQVEVLNQLGVKEISSVIGGSMGGMLAIEFAAEVRKPRVRSLVSLCSSGRHTPWQIGISECQRQAIQSDPNWHGGNYTKDSFPEKGMAVARMMAMLTYRTHPAYRTKFGRAMVSTSHKERIFDVENYLHEQGNKFIERAFEPMTYITLTRAMDSHDLERGRGSYRDVLDGIKIPTLLISISSDVLYPVSEQEELAALLPKAQHHIIQSNEGHDGFLLEHVKVGMLLQGFLIEMERTQMPSKL